MKTLSLSPEFLTTNKSLMPLDPTQIFDACRRNDRELVEKIYEENAEAIHTVDMKGFTPLILAVYNNSVEVVDFLLEKGAGTSGQDAAGNTALMGVCFKGYTELARKLVDAGADVNERNSNGATALTFAATFGHLQIAEILLQKGADVFVQDARGKTPLDHARLQENWPMYDLIEQYAVNK
ncbi:MAG: ankyrin repeat protein [Segetibacter sp.]|nr:ankyrin repeat protein [Segetibacter sp.]